MGRWEIRVWLHIHFLLERDSVQMRLKVGLSAELAVAVSCSPSYLAKWRTPIALVVTLSGGT